MTKEQALERLRSRCSRAEYCSGQIAETLHRWISSARQKAVSSGSSRKPGSPEGSGPQLCEKDIPDIISVLVAEKFIDDNRFANAFVRDKLKFNGWGKQKIIYRLKNFGIAGEVVKAAVEANYAAGEGDALSGRQVLEKLLAKKWESLKNEESLQKRRAKAIRFALGRGFEYGEVLEVMGAVERNSL